MVVQVHSCRPRTEAAHRLRFAASRNTGRDAIDGRLWRFDTISKAQFDALGTKVHPRLGTAHCGHTQPTIAGHQLCELGIVLLHQFIEPLGRLGT